MSAAKFVRDVNPDSRGDQKLWKVGDVYVVTSATEVWFGGRDPGDRFGGPETYVFAADDHGVVTDWCELAGSFTGSLDHDKAIAGYVTSITEAAT